jgi:hypothetical protein
LGQYRAAGVSHRRQQVHRAAVAACRTGAAQRLAVDGDGPPPADRGTGTLLVGQPGADRAGQASVSRRASVRRMVASAVMLQWPGAWWRAPSAARTGWGASAAHSAIAANDRAPASTAAAAMARMATNRWRRPRVARGSGTVAR